MKISEWHGRTSSMITASASNSSQYFPWTNILKPWNDTLDRFILGLRNGGCICIKIIVPLKLPSREVRMTHLVLGSHGDSRFYQLPISILTAPPTPTYLASPGWEISYDWSNPIVGCTRTRCYVFRTLPIICVSKLLCLVNLFNAPLKRLVDLSRASQKWTRERNKSTVVPQSVHTHGHVHPRNYREGPIGMILMRKISNQSFFRLLFSA